MYMYVYIYIHINSSAENILMFIWFMLGLQRNYTVFRYQVMLTRG